VETREVFFFEDAEQHATPILMPAKNLFGCDPALSVFLAFDRTAGRAARMLWEPLVCVGYA